MTNKPQAKPFGKHYTNAMKAHASEIGLPKLERAVLNVLLDHINYETGQSRPGRARIMELSGYSSERSMDRALKALRDRQIIRPLAYLNGGRGRATCYGFCLEAWTKDTPAKNAVDNEAPPNINPRNPVTKPPQSSPQTPAKNAAPTERTNRTDRRPKAGRLEGGPTASPTGSSSAFDKWDGQENYSIYLGRLKRWEREVAMMGETV